MNPSPALLLSIVAGMALGSACAPPPRPKDKGVLVVSKEQAASWTRNFNPLSPLASPRWPTMAGIYEPLVVWNSVQGRYVPWLGTQWQFSDDNLSVRITLRDGVRWSDGQPYVADDVAFTFDLLKRFPALDKRGVWSLRIGKIGPLLGPGPAERPAHPHGEVH